MLVDQALPRQAPETSTVTPTVAAPAARPADEESPPAEPPSAETLPLGSPLVTAAPSQPPLPAGFAMLGLVSLLKLPRAGRDERLLALSGAAVAGWFLLRGRLRRRAATR
ncbi:hypothetical protein MHAS_03225 [Mycolicibacterium hassiacum DSM 44199]|nr:hypothetical protein MHAS_03225 [Mycolicibacterium hassiacum DSM 44199]